MCKEVERYTDLIVTPEAVTIPITPTRGVPN